MYEDILNKTGAQFENLVAPARKLNSVVLEHVAKVSEFQLEAAKAYSDISLDQLRSLTQVTDAKSLQDFVSKQTNVAKTVGEKLNQDANTLAGFGKDLTAELQKLAQENIASVGKSGKAA